MRTLNAMNLDDTLQSIFSDILARPIGADEDVTRETEANWDSLKHMELIFTIEDECEVRFLEDDIAALASRSAFAERVLALRP